MVATTRGEGDFTGATPVGVNEGAIRVELLPGLQDTNSKVERNIIIVNLRMGCILPQDRGYFDLYYNKGILLSSIPTVEANCK